MMEFIFLHAFNHRLMDTTLTPVLVVSALIEEFEDEYVIHLPGSAKTFLVEPTMALVLSYCDGKKSVRDIIHTITELYPQRQTQIESDIPALIQQMLDAQVLQA